MLGVLRIRDYRLLLAGQLLSNTGNWLLLVAAPFFVFVLTGSTMATGLTLMAESVPAILLGPIAGVFADRWDRRRTMIATDLLRAAAVLSMLAVHGRGGVWIVYGALFVESGFSQFYNPGSSSTRPVICCPPPSPCRSATAQKPPPKLCPPTVRYPDFAPTCAPAFPTSAPHAAYPPSSPSQPSSSPATPCSPRCSCPTSARCSTRVRRASACSSALSVSASRLAAR
jgi:hypothetical protein